MNDGGSRRWDDRERRLIRHLSSLTFHLSSTLRGHYRRAVECAYAVALPQTGYQPYASCSSVIVANP
jgi:hypothetical protein